MSRSMAGAKLQQRLLQQEMSAYSLEATKSAISQSQLNAEQIKAILASKGLEGQILETTTAELAQITANNANAASQNAAAGASGNFKLALKGLTSTLGTTKLLLGGISIALGLAYIAFSKYKQYLEEIRQATEESANAYKESASSIEDYTKRYQELREALLAAKGNEEETYNVKKQLLDLQTELNDKFGEEYGAINLVTEAYKDQTDAIKSLNKEAAQTFLNENQKGIKQATAKMTDDNHYNLSYTGIISESDEGKILKEIAEKYKEQGVRLSEELDGAQFSIHLDADPQSAYKTIQSFENDVRDKARELGDEHLFDDVLEISSASLNDAKSTIDKYGDIYRQALTADIVSDDSKAKVYNDALEAVKAYNEAVLQSEDIYNDESVENARQSLQALHDEINNNEAWEKYGFLMDDVFDQADTRLLDFNNQLKNDSGLKELTKDLKGLSNLDLKALDENVGDNTSFDKLKEFAESCNVKVEELIDSLVRLGVIQGQISSESDAIEVPSFNTESFTEAIESLASLQSIYNDFYNDVNKDKVDFTFDISDIEKLRETFGDTCQSFDEFERLATSSSTTAEQMQDAFDRLATEFVFHSGVLDGLNTTTGEQIASQLELQGIMGASSLLTEEFAQACEDAETANIDFTNATLAQISGFIQEGQYAEDTRRKIYLYALQKKLANENCLNTYADIMALEALCKNLGVATDALIWFARAKSLQSQIDSGVDNAVIAGQLENAKNKCKEVASQISVTSSAYTGMGQSAANAAKSAEKGSKSSEKETDIMSELNSEMDRYQSQLKAIREARESYNESGKISIDQAQDILDADFRLLAAYGDEEAALEDLGKAKLNEMQIQLARNAIDTVNHIQSEAEAAQYLAGANENLAGSSLNATEAMLQQAVAAAGLRGELQGAAADVILQGYQNAVSMLSHVDFSLDSSGEKKEKTALEKFQDWLGTLFDWMEIRLERQAKKIDRYTKRADTALDEERYGTAIKNYRKAKNASVTQVGYQEQTYEKYSGQAESVLNRAMAEGLISSSMADSIRKNIRNGSADISEYGEEVQSVISSYKEWYDKAQEAKDAIDELHDSIRKYIKDMKDAADAQRDAKISLNDTFTEIGTGGNAFTVWEKNARLTVSISNLKKQNKAYTKETSTFETDTDYKKTGNAKDAYTAVKSEAKKASEEYREALQNAEKAIKAKKKVSDKDLKVILSNNRTVYENVYAYNFAIDNLENARLEESVNYASTSADIFSSMSEKYENRASALSEKMTELETKYSVAGRLKTQSDLMDQQVAVSRKTVANDTKAVNEFKKEQETNASGITKFSAKKLSKEVKTLAEAIQAKVKEGKAVTPSQLSKAAKYVKSGDLKQSFYESCVNYNEALSYREQYEAQKTIDQYALLEQKKTARDTKLQDQLDLIERNASTASASLDGACTAKSKNRQLDYSDSVSKKNTEAYKTRADDAYADIDYTNKDSSAATALADTDEELKKATGEYKNALDTAKKAIQAKKYVPKEILDIIIRYNEPLWHELYQYNRAIEMSSLASEEYATAYAAQTASIMDNIAERYKNLDSQRQEEISLFEQQSSNATDAKNKNRFLDKISSAWDDIMANDIREFNEYDSRLKSSISDITSMGASGTARGEYYKSLNTGKESVDRYISKALASVRSGQLIDPDVLSKLCEYAAKRWVSMSFWEACYLYNEAFTAKESAEHAKEVDAERIKAEKESLATEKFKNYEQEYQNRLDENQGKTSKISAAQALKQVRGYSLTESDYQELKKQSINDQAILEAERKVLQKQMDENLARGDWDKNSQAYKDAAARLNEIDVEIINCQKDQREFSNTIRQLPIDRFEKLIETLGKAKDLFAALLGLRKQQGLDLTDDEILKQINDNNDIIREQEGKLAELQKDYEEAVANGADADIKKYKDDILDTQNAILGLKTENEALNDSLIDLRVNALNKEKEALEKLNEVEDRKLAIEKAQLELAKASQRTQLVYNGEQFVYTKDEKAYKDALEALEKAEFDELINTIEDAIDALEDLKKDYNLYDKDGNPIDQKAIITAMSTGADNIVARMDALIDVYKNRPKVYETEYGTLREVDPLELPYGKQFAAMLGNQNLMDSIKESSYAAYDRSLKEYMSTPVTNNTNYNDNSNTTTIQYNISNVNLPEVKDADGFARAIVEKMHTQTTQQIYKSKV